MAALSVNKLEINVLLGQKSEVKHILGETLETLIVAVKGIS